MPLLPGEEFNFAIAVDAAMASSTSDREINEKYASGEIRIVTEQARYPLNTIKSMLETQSYRLNPEYQRRHRWSNDKKSRLIESLIINVPIPPVFLYEYDFSKYEVMDGLQRLSAISDFYGDKFALEGLEQWRELTGRKYSTLPDKIREGIDRRYLSSVILLKETAKTEAEATRLKQLVFERLNSGGERLVDQEARNAIYDGPLNRLCLRLSLNRSLCRLWGIPEPSEAEEQGAGPTEERLASEAYRQMQDVELVLRFFAYRQKHSLHRGTDLGAYLDAYLKNGNGLGPSVLAGLRDVFERTIVAAEEIFGESAFWLYRNRHERWDWLERPTTTVYDPLMRALSDRLDNVPELIERRTELRQMMPDFYRTNYEAFEGRNVNRSALVQRDEKFSALLDGFLV
jgi:hypothetical protein